MSVNPLEHIAFEDIDDVYCYGMYCDFRVIMMKSNGYINATKMCQYICEQTGSRKTLYHWNENKSHEGLYNAICASIGAPMDALFNVVKGGTLTQIRGTYVHPKLIPHIAAWASDEFAVKVSDIVNQYFNSKALAEKDAIIQERDDRIDQLIKEMRHDRKCAKQERKRAEEERERIEQERKQERKRAEEERERIEQERKEERERLNEKRIHECERLEEKRIHECERLEQQRIRECKLLEEKRIQECKLLDDKRKDECERIEHDAKLRHDESMAKIDRLLRKNKKISNKLGDMKERNELLIQQNDELSNQSTDILDRMNQAAEDRAPVPDDIRKTNSFVILKDETPNVVMPYYAVRTQKCNLEATIGKRKQLNDKVRVMMSIQYNPNSVNLWVRIKAELRGCIEFHANLFKLIGDYTEDELIQDVQRINNEKYDV
jgi:hypothetical protein